MSTYSEIKAQIAELEHKARQVRSTEIASAKAKIAEIMKAYGLRVSDLDISTKPQSSRDRQPVPVKYRDDSTGKTWSGRGRAPSWILGKNRTDFLIK